LAGQLGRFIEFLSDGTFSNMTPKRKQLVLSVCMIPVLIGIASIAGAVTPKPEGNPQGMSGFAASLFVVTMLWMFFGPAIFASRYAKELGMPGGVWGLMSIFFPVITPAILAAIRRPALPALAPDTMIAGKSIRDWNLGQPIKAFNTTQFLGMGGHTLVLTTEGFAGDDPRIGCVAWSQVREIYQNLRDQYMNGMQTARVRQYDLVLEGGRRLRIDGRYSDIDQLGRHLQLQVTTALNAAVGAMLERGDRLAFGPLAVTPTGLSFKGQELPWSEVESVGVNMGYLVIGRSAGGRADYAVHRSIETVAGVLTRIAGTAQPMLGGGRGIQWKKIAANKVPNIYLLIAVAEVMRSKARSAAAV
jgi:hypothetical protein